MIKYLVERFLSCKNPFKTLPLYIGFSLILWAFYFFAIQKPGHTFGLAYLMHEIFEVISFVSVSVFIWIFKQYRTLNPLPVEEDESLAQIESLTDKLIERDESIQKSKEMLQIIFDSVPIRIFWKNPDLKYVAVNKAFALDAGLSHPSEAIGKSDLELPWADKEASVYRRSDRQVIDTNEAILHTREPQTRADESKATISSSKVPLHGADGNIIGVLGLYEDITKQIQQEKELALSRKKWRDFFKNSLVGMYQASFETFEIMECNQEAAHIFGYKSPEEVIGTLLSDRYKDAVGRDKIFDIILTQGHIRDLECLMLRKDGSPIWIRAHIFLYREEGLIEGVFTDFYPKQPECPEEIKNGRLQKSI